jgi:hypothetical protein
MKYGHEPLGATTALAPAAASVDIIEHALIVLWRVKLEPIGWIDLQSI